MMHYKVLLNIGHVGASKSNEEVRYFKAENVGALLDTLKHYPGIKEKERGKGILNVEPVSEQEYETGRIFEWKKDYISGKLLNK